MVSKNKVRPTRKTILVFFVSIATVFIVFIVFTYTLSNILANTLRSQRITEIPVITERHVLHEEENFAEALNDYNNLNVKESLKRVAQEISVYPGVGRVSFINGNGVLIWSNSETVIVEDFVTDAERVTSLEEAIGHLYRTERILSISSEEPLYVEKDSTDPFIGHRNTLIYVPIFLKTSGETLFVEILFDESAIFQDTSRLRNIILATASGSIGFLILILYFIFSRLYRKIFHQQVEIDSYIDELQETVGKTREELTTTKTQFEKIVTSANEIITIIDDKLKIVFVNNAIEDILDYSKEDVLGKSVKKFIKAEGLLKKAIGGMAMRLFAKTGKGPLIGKRIDAVLLKESGEEVRVEFTISSLKLQKKWHILAIARDVTEREKAVEEKIQVLKQAQHYFNIAPVIMLVLNKNGQVLDINREGANILGFEKDEVIGRNWFKHFIPKKQKEQVRELFGKCIRNEEGSEEYKNFVINAKGEERLVKWRNIALTDKEGNPEVVLSSGVDITKEEQVAQKLQEGEQRFKDIVLSSQDVIWELNKKREVVFIDGAVEEIFGYTAEELLGITPSDSIDQEKSGEALRLLESIFNSKRKIVDLVNWNRRKDGSLVCILTNGVPIFDEKNQFKGYRGVHKDITEQIRTQEALMESEEEYENLYNNAPAMFVSVDTNTKRILKVNDSFLKKTGFDRDEVIGKIAYSFIVTSELESAKEFSKAFEAGKAIQNAEFAIKTKDSDKIETRVNATPVLDESGEIIESRLILTDISDLKKVRSEQEKAAQISEISPFIILEVGLDGRIQYMNKAAKKKQKAGLNIKQNNERLHSEIWKAVSGELGNMAGNFNLAIEDYVLDITIVKYEDRIIIFMRDRTKQEKLEREVNELDKLKSRFITALTHVARTPLSEVRWSLESLAAGEFGSLNEAQTTMISKALESENEVLQIIDNMNLVLDIERDTMRLERSMASIESVAKSVVSINETECTIKNLTCEIVRQSSKLPQIYIDPKKIHIALKLVFENGLNYSESEGSVQMILSKTKKNVIIKVKDQGVGIPNAELENIKERFFRASNAQSVHPNGVGLGLFIADAIIEKHGGSLNIKSKEGEGTEVTITLPIGKTDAEE